MARCSTPTEAVGKKGGSRRRWKQNHAHQRPRGEKGATGAKATGETKEQQTGKKTHTKNRGATNTTRTNNLMHPANLRSDAQGEQRDRHRHHRTQQSETRDSNSSDRTQKRTPQCVGCCTQWVAVSWILSSGPWCLGT